MSSASLPVSPPLSSPLSAAVPPSTALAGRADADHVVAHTLLNCLLREVSGPEHQTAVSDGHLLLRLPRCGVLLRVALRRASLIGAHRFAGSVSEQRPEGWAELSWQTLAEYIHRELHLRTGVRNEEFLTQVASSHEGVSAALAAARRQTATPDPSGAGRADAYMDSEQSLLFGHRFHPTPKARTGALADWGRYAPETRARFPLRHLAVREEFLRQETATPGALAALDRQGTVPDGYRLLPAHPWQYAMLRDHPALVAAIDRGDVLDLGPRGADFEPTASVRTLYDGRDFLKFSLNVRITNCLRKNAEYELTGAVALTRLLEPVAADLAARFPGTDLLREPAYRTLDLGSRELAEGFGVIVREGLDARLAPGVTGLLAAAVADEYPTGGAQLARLLAGAGPAEALAWWDAYLGLLVPPVLAAYFDHGVVLEPHLQNVVLGVDADGAPRQVLFRDLEGTKLLPEQHATALAALAEDVARPMTYDRERGWDRVVYCLLVNHLAEMLAALADRHPRLEPELWRAVRGVLAGCAAAHGNPPLLRALIAGVPLPAKANLLTRWERKADRDAGYVRIASPLVPDLLSATSGAARTEPWSTTP
ncbi:N(2)-citryl-N(6)-acetyl-N(6)-hydroxylysinesynthase [Streptomyces netropsis]|uniref:Siderophore synthetase component n=1 Tax=Streptomyces syringium TaxID=76729 RepID=A0ABS4YBN9_9ACTN|nr:IucA/IucC family protein [Streptomyces syringium]MBP2406210.1 siderophore synthetase component [Streptomyces syringium]SPE63893.1 N(2)-citryl-N(6)-acetyl-N(6)-hydroxylysinesynthase [Streptomyces netropsis]